MTGYYLRLALKSLRRTPGLTALMVCAIALGIAACIVTLTVYHAMSGNPIWWKNNVLYVVTMDSWDANRPADTAHPALPPPQMTYTDATALLRSDIPERKAIMTQLNGKLSGAPGQGVPIQVLTRATTKDFFTMFDVPFEYGGPWTGNDLEALPEIVLSKHMNDTLFGGTDSVGRTILWNNNRFRVVGVLRNWQPLPRFYDLIDGAFAPPEDAYVPFSWVTTLQALPMGNMNCHGDPNGIAGFQQLLASECVWIEMWVELPSAARRAQFRAYMDSYWAAQRRSGRFPRPLNNRLTNVGQWLQVNGVVTSDSRILLRVAFAFLAVCLINTVGILLTKFLRGAPVVGVRRALGASRSQIFLQHLVEVAVVSIAGAVLGLTLGAAGLAGVQTIYTQDSGGYGMLAHFDPLGVVWALALAALSTLAAGLYPAWSIGRLPPAGYLKSR